MKGYMLEKKDLKERVYEVYIVADSNDGDYISTKTNYTEAEFDEIVWELINLKENYMERHKLPSYDNSVADLYIPYAYDEYCHTLEKITITMYDVDGKVWNVDIGYDKETDNETRKL